MNAPKAVIFDLDGCLVDSEPKMLESITAQMRELGILDAMYEEIRDSFLGVTMAVIRDHVSKRLGRDCPADFQQRVEARLYEDYRQGLARISGVTSLLQALSEQDMPTAIATGGSVERLGKTLYHSGLEAYFKGRAFSAEQVRRGKPAPDIFLYAAEQIGVAAEDCVVIEDSPHGVEGAVAAGMKAIGFDGGSHLRGIRDKHAQRLKAAGAEWVTRELRSLVSLLDRSS